MGYVSLSAPQQTGWLSEKASLDQQLVVEKQLREDTNDRLEQEKAIVKSESQTMQEALCLRMVRQDWPLP